MGINVPRLSKGKAFAGPEYAGCCGTGKRPVIVHSKAAGRYLVGTEFAIDTLRMKAILESKQRIFRSGSETLWAFKSRKPAVAKFLELCRPVEEYNAKMRAERARLKAQATRGDIGAAIGLLDF